ncbi:hypothetical protein [Acutalibacter caecimuris]|uniref:hypothetical protein n=1 Tax=Acutalibacter caecimuris TaxID=3093657 RepID=UPI002AC97CD0|nr:hypothetical protein [Acutalibacter sp. M00118]
MKDFAVIVAILDELLQEVKKTNRPPQKASDMTYEESLRFCAERGIFCFEYHRRHPDSVRVQRSAQNGIPPCDSPKHIMEYVEGGEAI